MIIDPAEDPILTAIYELKDEITTLKHILIGVDGGNGVRSNVKELKEQVKILTVDNIKLKQTIDIFKWLIPLVLGSGVISVLFSLFK